MANWTKTVASFASGLTCAAGGHFFAPATSGSGNPLGIPNSTVGTLGGQLSSTVAVTNGAAIQISGAIQNYTSAPTVGAVVALLSSSDGGTTWWFIDQAGAGIAAGTGALGTLTTAGNYPFSFSLIPDGNSLLALYVYNNVTNSVALWGEAFYGSSFG